MTSRERPYQDIHLVEIWGPSHSITTNKETYHQASNELVEKGGFTVMPGSDFVFPYPGIGFTYMAALSESGVMGHTWPDKKWLRRGNQREYANYVLHTCKRGADFSRLGDLAKEIFETEDVEVDPLFPFFQPQYHPSLTKEVITRIAESKNP